MVPLLLICFRPAEKQCSEKRISGSELSYFTPPKVFPSDSLKHFSISEGEFNVLCDDPSGKI